MTKWIWRFSILAALALGLYFGVRWAFAPRPIPIRALKVDRGRVESTVTNSKAGTVKARRRAQLSPEIGGRVVAIARREGERVKAGETLARLEDSVHLARVHLAERSLESSEASNRQACLAAARAKSELDRNAKLREEGHISEDLLEQLTHNREAALAACAASEAQVSQARASLDVARAELRKTVLEAPFDGVLAEVTLELGEWVTPSPPMVPVPSVIDIIDPTSIYISAPMDEVDSAIIRVDQEVRATLDSYPDREFPGRVVRIAPYVLDVESQNRTVEIEVELDDAEFARQLLPGTSADVEVLLAVETDALRIPSSSLLLGDQVLVLEGDHLRQRTVQVGLKNWEFAEIKGGLTAGEFLVTSLDQVGIEDGALVTVESFEELERFQDSPPASPDLVEGSR